MTVTARIQVTLDLPLPAIVIVAGHVDQVRPQILAAGLKRLQQILDGAADVDGVRVVGEPHVTILIEER